MLFVAACANGEGLYISSSETQTHSEEPISTPFTESQTQNTVETTTVTSYETTMQAIPQTTQPDLEPEQPFVGKIAVITWDKYTADREYYAGEAIVEKYGIDKVLHVSWPDNVFQLPQRMVNLISKLGSDPDIKVMIINPALFGTSVAIDKLKEERDDIFIVYITPYDTAVEIAQKANLALYVDELGIGPAAVRQAKKLGAKTFVLYSIPTRSGATFFSNQRDLVEQECVRLGIKFINTSIPDPYDEHGHIKTQEFILEDVSKTLDEHGKDTAFFILYDTLESFLFKAVLEAGAISPHCCTKNNTYVKSVAYALGMEIGEEYDVEEVIAQERERLAEKNMLGRISAWPDEYIFPLTIASADYAVKWINGEVPKDGIDRDVLTQIISEYVGVQAYLTPFINGYHNIDSYQYPEEGIGETYDNYLLMRMDYITFD